VWSDTQKEVASKEEEPPKKMIKVNIKTTVLKKKKGPKPNAANTIQEPSLAKDHAQRQQVAMIVEKWKISLNEKEDTKEQSQKTPSTPREPAATTPKEQSLHADNRKKTSSTPREPVVSTRKEQQSHQQAPDKRRNNDIPSPTRDPVVVSTHPSSQDKNPKKSPPAVIQKTAKGMPVCMLCQRKFRSIEQLRCHESLSQLHKDNMKKFELAKKEATKNSPMKKFELAKKEDTNNSPPTMRSTRSHHQETRPGPSTTRTHQYQDRSKKRKMLFEARADGLVLPTTRKKQRLRQVISSGIDVAGELKKVQERLDQQAAAMRVQSSIQQPSVPDYSSWLGGVARRPLDTNTMESIRKEWDRIEALASAPGPDSYKHTPSQLGSGLGFNN
jgi:hypothetical protein